MALVGFYLVEDGDIELNAGRRTVEIVVANTGDRPVQVGSHAHFFEVNRALRFDRRAAFGMRLDIPSGTAVRFEPGDRTPVTLVAFGGAGMPAGMNGLVAGADTEAERQQSEGSHAPQAHPERSSEDAAVARAEALGFVLEADA